MPSETPKSPEPSLGLVELLNGTVDRDFSVSSGYQAFSAELLRLALLGITAIGFLLVQLDPGLEGNPSIIRENLGDLRPWIYAALACFGLCSAAALGHRYCSNDGLACHVKYLRLLNNGYSKDSSEAKKEKCSRKTLWQCGTWLLAMASLSLAIGAITLAITFAMAVGLLSKERRLGPAVEQACAVDQILKLKEAGLSSDQIKSVCGERNGTERDGQPDASSAQR